MKRFLQLVLMWGVITTVTYVTAVIILSDDRFNPPWTESEK